MDHDRPDNPYIDVVQYFCPDTMNDTDIRSHFEGLEIALNDLNGAHIPHLEIHCGAHKTAKGISRLLLEGSIFSHYFSELQKVSLSLDYRGGWTDILPDEILSAPTHFALRGTTIELNTAQRAEWPLSKELSLNWRDRYLRDLLEASRAASAAPVDSPLAASTLPDAGADVLARAEKNAEHWEQANAEGEGMAWKEDEVDMAGTEQDEKDPRGAEEDEASGATVAGREDGET